MSEISKLLTDETNEAFMNRFKLMQKHKNSAKGDELFVSKLVAVSEQVSNLHVRSKINGFEINNDGSRDLGGFNNGPSPTEALLGCLANCCEQTALIYFTFSKIKVKSIKVKIEAKIDKRSSLNPREIPLPGFYDFKIMWFINSDDHPRKIKQVLAKVALNCPVKATIERSYEFLENTSLLEGNKEDI
jgi:uncharacterized OsmC-like protein